MSTRKEVGKYYDIDWDPSQGSVNTATGFHPLRDRARKLNQGIQIIRFEMPFHVICLHCQKHISTGFRFNAEKKVCGKYLEMPRYEFTMHCNACQGVLKVQTDPENRQFQCVEGLKRRDIVDISNTDVEQQLQRQPKSVQSSTALREHRGKQQYADEQGLVSQLQQHKTKEPLLSTHAREVLGNTHSDVTNNSAYRRNEDLDDMEIHGAIRKYFRKRRQTDHENEQAQQKQQQQTGVGIHLLDWNGDNQNTKLLKSKNVTMSTMQSPPNAATGCTSDIIDQTQEEEEDISLPPPLLEDTSTPNSAFQICYTSDSE